MLLAEPFFDYQRKLEMRQNPNEENFHLLGKFGLDAARRP